MSLVIDFSGPAIAAPTVSASLTNVVNGAANGTVVGSGSTTLSGSSISLIEQGGVAVQAVGATLEINTSFSVNRQYRRTIGLVLGAAGSITGDPAFNVNSITGLSLPTQSSTGTTTVITGLGPGVLSCTSMAVSISSTQQFLLPVIESGAPSLTVSISGAVTTLTEYNDSLPPDSSSMGNYLGTISASGGTGPYQYAVIGQQLAISSGTYNSASGAIVLTMPANVAAQPTSAAVLSGLTGTGAFASLDGTWIITAISGPTVTIQGPIGAGAATITGGTLTLDNCPMEVEPYSGVLAMVGFCTTSAVGLSGSEGVNFFTGTSQTALVRAVDSLGAYGYLTVGPVAISVCNVETDAELTNAIFIDPANATLSGSNVVSVAAVCNGVNYTVVVPAGSNVTLTPYTGPDGNVRNLFVYSNGVGTGTSLAAGSAFAGSSTALVALFNQTSIPNNMGTLMSVMNIANLSHSRTFGGFSDAGSNGLTSRTPGPDQLIINTNANGASLNFEAVANITPGGANGWAVLAACSSGPRSFGENNQLQRGFLSGAALPASGSFTPTSIQIGIVVVAGAGWQSALEVLAPVELTFHQREKIYAYVARRTGAAYTPPPRKAVSQMQPSINITNFNTAFGTSGFRHLQFISTFQYSPSTGVCALSSEYAVEVDMAQAGLSAVWPEWNGYVNAQGALVQPLYAMTSAQKTWLAANPGTSLPHAASYYGYRGIVNEFKNVCAQFLGYWEAKVTYPLGDGLTPDFWLYNYFGGGDDAEIDIAEQYGSSAPNPSMTAFFLHSGAGGQPFSEFIPVDSSTGPPNYFGCDWIDNFNGTHTLNYYWNRRQFGTVTVPAADLVYPMHMLMTQTSGDGGSPPTAYTPIGNLASAVVTYWLKVWAYPSNDSYQPPQLVKLPSITGTRGNGNTMTMIPGVYNWPAATPTYQWYTFSPQTGFVKLTGQTALTLTDATAYQSLTLMCQESSQNLRFDHPMLGNAFAEPGTLPSMSLLTGPTSTTGAAQGTVLAWLYNQALGAGVTITSSDVSGNFQMSADGTQVQAGPNWHTNAISVGVTLYVTQTALLSGPTPLAQTFTITPN